MTVVVSVIGGPGTGKSTLCTALAQHYAAAGRIVDHFEEHDILSRPAFSAVASEFGNGTGPVDPQTLIDAFGRYVGASAADDTDLVITDALVPFIPSLLAWGHTETEIERVIAELEKVSAGVSVIVVLLAGDPAVTLPRAIAREADGWADSYIQKLAQSPGTSHVVSVPTAIDQLRREAALSRRRLAGSEWEVLELDAGARPEALVEIVKRRLAAILPR